MKIARIATVPFSLHHHLRRQIMDTVKAGHEVVLVSSGGPEVDSLRKMEGVRFLQIEIQRKISLIQDLFSLWQLFWVFRKERFDVVHTITPKAGMLGALASFLARVPIRLHTFTGQPWAEMRGFKRHIAKLGDRLTAILDTRCYADSPSQRKFMADEAISPASKIHVLGAGSLAGVDLQRFNPENTPANARQALQRLQIPEAHLIITFIGRITEDKGIRELIAAFRALQADNMPCSLLLIGPEEPDTQQLYRECHLTALAHVHLLGYQQNPEYWLSITNIFCLPSYREGFGNVVMEAAAMGVPTVGTDIPGLRDAVIHRETGILVPAKNVEALTQALKELLINQNLCSQMGRRAFVRAHEKFDADKLNALMIQEYHSLSGLSK